MSTYQMTPAEQRAYDYVRIFIELGDDWTSCAPVDGRMLGNGSIFIDGVELRRNRIGRWGMHRGDGWVWYALKADS